MAAFEQPFGRLRLCVCMAGEGFYAILTTTLPCKLKLALREFFEYCVTERDR